MGKSIFVELRLTCGANFLLTEKRSEPVRARPLTLDVMGMRYPTQVNVSEQAMTSSKVRIVNIASQAQLALHLDPLLRL